MTGQMDSPRAANTTKHDVIGAENTQTKQINQRYSVCQLYYIRYMRLC